MEYFVQLSILSLWVRLHLLEIILLLLTVYLFFKIFLSRSKRGKKLPPGPFGLPVVGNLPFLGPKPYETVAKMRKIYGNIIGLKFGKNFVVVLNEFNVMREGLSHPAALNRPDIFGTLNFGFGFANGQAWSEQRRFVVQTMRSLGLGKGPMESLSKESVKSFIQKLKSLKGKPVNIATDIEGCFCNDLMYFVYGRKFDPETEKDKIEEIAKFSALISKCVGSCSFGSYIPGFLKFCEYFKIGEYHQVAECTKMVHALARKEIKKHLLDKDCQNLPDFLDAYRAKMEEMKTSKEKHYFTNDFMLDNANALFLGGTTTSVNAMVALFRSMAANLDVQEQVHKELDSVIGRDGSISFGEKSKVPYTFAVMLEAQRYFSVIPFTTTRILSEDIELEGYLIPKGSHMIGNTWAIHNDPENWKDPHLFQPERFLSEDKTEIIQSPSKYVPFSIGKQKSVNRKMFLSA